MVTGSVSGIGAALARKLASLGAGVVVNSSSSVGAGEELAAELPDAVYVQGDVAAEGVGGALVAAALDRWGRLDGLINNAGITSPVALADFEQLRAEDWRQVLSANVIGSFLITQAALPHLRQADGGWVINIGSIAGLRAIGSSLPYSVSKAALAHLTLMLAKLVGPEVRVNNVAPGLIDTPWTASWDVMRAGAAAVAPLKRTGLTDDVVEACLALIRMKYVTGHTLVVDGGLTLSV